ncbi:MAG: EI24 domain-containing protein [Pseudomonadota bacterium]|nr:EI24 domain-containing protein [Pseudomonadota bacterium]
MKLLLDSFWRAAAYCLYPRVIALSLLPLGIMLALTFLLGYFFWQPALQAVRGWLQGSGVITTFWGWLQPLGVGSVGDVLAPVALVLGVTPLIVLASLLLVALLLAPAMLRLVAARRFGQLARQGSGSVAASALWSLGHTALALLALAVTLPLWLVPPLILLLPPLIWGWLTYRVMSFDALAEHASAEERRALLKAHRWPLLVMGVVCGYLGAAPGVVWASATLFAVAFALLIPVAIWIYTLVFAFSSLWFTHYCLAALQAHRAMAGKMSIAPAPQG